MQQESITAIRTALKAFDEDPGHAAQTLLTQLQSSRADVDFEAVAAVLDQAQQLLETWVATDGPKDSQALLAAVEPLVRDGLQQAADLLEFQESLSIFLETTPLVVAEIEEELLEADRAGPERAAESVAQVRRTMHTLKAEFGVLGLNAGQKLCHDAESTIDILVERGEAFPVDMLLRLVDWVKDYSIALAADSAAAPPDSEQLLGELEGLAVGGAGSIARAPTAEPSGQMEPQTGQPAAATGIRDCGAPDFPQDAAGRVLMDVTGDFADSVDEFASEAQSHLRDAEAAMLAFESDPEDLEQVNTAFRAFHTIKGVAGFLGLTALVELSHDTEALLDEARVGRRIFSPDDIDLVLKSGDLIERLLGALQDPEAAPEAAELQALLAGLETAIAETRSTTTGVGSGPDDTGPVDATPRKPAHCDGGAAPGVDAATKVPMDPADPTEPAGQSAGDGAAVLTPAPAPQYAPAAAAGPGNRAAARRAGRPTKVDSAIKVNTSRLDTLVDMVGELVIAQSMVLQDPQVCSIEDQTLNRNVARVAKITRDLQEAAMTLRMVAVKATFQKMVRLVRDVSSKSGKKVEIEVTGEDTELDRNVVEQLADPLVHMIRNACDHGVEPPEERVANGKPAVGRLWLHAYHQGGAIVIEICDDGRGMDRERILAKAREKGLIQTSGEELSDGDVYQMIFLPGFSTAAQVTDISGRGVGMDVVRKNIEALRGKIEIESELGRGTTFRMRLPLTLAIIDGMILRVGRERYVLPTLAIEQSIKVEEQEIHTLVGRGEMIDVRGSMLPIYRLYETFGIEGGCTDIRDGVLLVIESDGERSCLLVDEIVGQQQVVIKSLGRAGKMIRGVSGGAIMSDGIVALILDVASLVEDSIRVGCGSGG